MENSPDAKKPCKGILKTSSSFDRPGASYRKSAKFDELNVLQTYHPPDKDYGHMKIDEPKTPYNYSETEFPDQLDANLLAEKLRIAADTQASFEADSVGVNFLDEEYLGLSEEEKARRMEFVRRRKMHYNEYEAVRLARKLIEEEFDGDEEERDNAAAGVSGENLKLSKSVKNDDKSDEDDEPEDVETVVQNVIIDKSDNIGDGKKTKKVSTKSVTSSMEVDQQCEGETSGGKE